MHAHLSLANGRVASLGRAGADVACRVDPCHARLQQVAATYRWAGEDESVLVAGDRVVEPVGAWACAEEQEQVGEGQALTACEGDGFELPVLAVELCDLAAVTNRDAVALEVPHEVVRHCLVQVRAAVQKRDERASTREPHGGLAGRVSPAEDGDARSAAEHLLRRPGGVEDGQSFVVGEALDSQAPVLRASREQDRTGGDLVALGEPDEVPALPRFERDRAIGRCGTRSELPRLHDGSAGQLAPADPGGKAEVVLDPARGSGLSAERAAFDDQRVKALRGSIDGGAEAGGAGANDEQVDFLLPRELAPYPECARELPERWRLHLNAAGQSHERQALGVQPGQQCRRVGIVAAFWVAPGQWQTVAASELQQPQGRGRRARSEDLEAEVSDLLHRLPPRDERREQQIAERPVIEQQRSQRIPLYRDVSQRPLGDGGYEQGLARQ